MNDKYNNSLNISTENKHRQINCCYYYYYYYFQSLTNCQFSQLGQAPTVSFWELLEQHFTSWITFLYNNQRHQNTELVTNEELQFYSSERSLHWPN